MTRRHADHRFGLIVVVGLALIMWGLWGNHQQAKTTQRQGREIQRTAKRLAFEEWTTCTRQVDGFHATLALGDIIREARTLSTDTPTLERARADLVRIAPAGLPPLEARALHDLQVLVAGGQKQPRPPTRLLLAEGQYLSLVGQLKKPRDCGPEPPAPR